MKILVTRTDRLGDLVLTLPVFEALKTACPAWEIHAMVAPGAVPLVENDPHLARVWTWRDDLSAAEAGALSGEVAAEGFTAAVMIQYRRELAKMLREAGIARRYGPWSKWSSWIHLNRGQRQNRSGGGHHEMEFNLQLAERLLRDEGHTASNPLGPRLYLNAAQQQLARDFRAEYGAEKLVFLHPGSGGSALDWEPERFATVANVLAAEAGRKVFITGAGPDAGIVADVVMHLQPTVTVLLDKFVLRDFLAVLAAADLFIGPSTGPLHLAAALGVPTLGLYPPVRTMHPDRWGPRSFVNPAPRNLMPELDCPARRLCRLERCEHYNCLNELRVEAVLTAAREILGPELP